ncbi:MAG: adenylate kinase [Bacteroidales bacterium]|nr:adenylate kinase [Bacteroidales bacterium]RLD38724.1 MAG: adenylate kinase [Bacteroidota bacterium]
MLNIALFGPPGAGKGTQSKMLLEKYDLTYISTGDMLREEIAEGTKLGMKAKSVIERGELVSDEIIVQLIEKRIVENVNPNGILFDGFPRTTVQAYILDGLLLRINAPLTCMISLEVPREELVSRMMERSKVSGRADDTEEVIQFRLKEYDNKTKPVAEFYKAKGKYTPIKGTGEIKDIFNTITDSIQQTLRKTWINVVLYGPPGSGKGTQALKLAEKYNLVYISTGKMLRKEVLDNTEIGRKAAPYMKKGEIVPDEIAITLIERRIQEHPEAKGFVFKGFPKTMVQAYILDGLLLKLNQSVSIAIGLETSTLECFKRLSARGKTKNRRPYDASMEMIINRIDEFIDHTVAVGNYYENQGTFVSIDGHGSQDEIFERLVETMDKALLRSR